MYKQKRTYNYIVNLTVVKLKQIIAELKGV